MQNRWCYPIERCLKTVRKKCGNKGRIEASIAEAFIHEEVSNFTTTYYNPPARYNEDNNESTLSLFKGPRGRASRATTKTLSYEEWCKIMLYVLTNLDEVETYLG